MVIKQTSISDKSNVSEISRNKWLFILTKLDLTAMVLPVIVKIWENAGLNFNKMLLLQGLFSISLVLFEIPSGSISDTFKRKYVLAAGYTFLAGACLSYSLGYTFSAFIISEILFGMGVATISGSDTSLVYDTLVKYEKEGEFKKILGRASTLSFIAALVSILLSGVIGLYSLRWPLYLLTGTFVVKIFLSMGMVEVERTKAQNARKATKDAFSTLLHSTTLVAVLLAFISYSVAQRVAFWAYQPKLFTHNFSPFYIGLVFAGMNLIAAISSSVLSKMKEKHEDLLLVIFLILELVNIFVLWITSSLLILITIMFVQIARGGRSPVIGTMIQRKAKSELRATLLSIYSAIGNMLYFITSIIFTLLDLSMKETLLVMLMFSIVIFCSFIYLVAKKNGKKGVEVIDF
ncbi:MAG: MFS transporter [Candidatus Heimdallarchaeaceae archaeon]